MLRLLALLAVLTVPVTGAGVVATAPAPPLVVFAAPFDGVVLLAWVPGDLEGADEYRVYGLLGDTTHLLAAVDGQTLTATVAPGYERYAVSALRDGMESERTASTPC